MPQGEVVREVYCAENVSESSRSLMVLRVKPKSPWTKIKPSNSSNFTDFVLLQGSKEKLSFNMKEALYF